MRTEVAGSEEPDPSLAIIKAFTLGCGAAFGARTKRSLINDLCGEVRSSRTGAAVSWSMTSRGGLVPQDDARRHVVSGCIGGKLGALSRRQHERPKALQRRPCGLDQRRVDFGFNAARDLFASLKECSEGCTDRLPGFRHRRPPPG